MESVTSDPDADLMDHCRSGKSGAWEKFCARYADQLYRLALSITHEGSAAEDCVQETLLEVWKNLSQFKGTGVFRAWLFTIARNKALQYQRKPRPQTYGELPEACIADDPAKVLMNAELRDQIDLALQQMPEKWRTAWVLREVEEVPFKEIAEILCVTDSGARGLYFRAQRSLRAYLEQQDIGPD